MKIINIYKNDNGFSLIELLVVIAIIGILLGLSIFGILGSRANARDAKRKADLEVIRSGLEMYKSDKGYYPAVSGWCTVLWGCGVSSWYNDVAGALISGGYLSQLPQDPIYANTNLDYFYKRTAYGYELYSQLESDPNNSISTSTCGCGVSGDDSYDYKVINP